MIFMCFSAGIWAATSLRSPRKGLHQISFPCIDCEKNDAFLCLLFLITHQKGSKDLSGSGTLINKSGSIILIYVIFTVFAFL